MVVDEDIGFEIILKTAEVYIGRTAKGHRDRYIGSLFRVDGPVPMIQLSNLRYRKGKNTRRSSLI